LRFSRYLLAFILALSLPAALSAGSKEKEPSARQIDSGSFGVFMGTRRIATETFSITQNANGSVVQSEFKTDGTPDHAAQSSEMQLTGTGEIRRYDWKELNPGKGQSTVLPNEQFLTQKWTASPDDKPQEQPYLLPASTSILDDYFFVHREVLAWKFLASSCNKDSKGQLQCPLKQRSQFGTLNPHQRSSASVSMEFLGREKTTIRGAQQDLLKVELKSDAGAWELWLDDQFKVLRMSVPAENTEVVRD
jgi:hypothetical protein